MNRLRRALSVAAFVLVLFVFGDAASFAAEPVSAVVAGATPPGTPATAPTPTHHAIFAGVAGLLFTAFGFDLGIALLRRGASDAVGSRDD